MTRILVFEGPRAPTRFQFLWMAIILDGDGKKDRAPAIIRKEARLQTALEAISDPVAGNGADQMEMRALTGEGGTLTIAQEDFDLLQSYTEKTGWTPRASRDVVDLWDWLSTAEKKE